MDRVTLKVGVVYGPEIAILCPLGSLFKLGFHVECWLY